MIYDGLCQKIIENGEKDKRKEAIEELRGESRKFRGGGESQ